MRHNKLSAAVNYIAERSKFQTHNWKNAIPKNDHMQHLNGGRAKEASLKNRTGLYLLVSRSSEGVLDRVGWVSALLAAEAPLTGGVARATGHPSLVLASCCGWVTDQRL